MLGSRVYVGTWGKYNDGNLDGAWVELSDFDSYEDFLDYAAELHKDEYSPEFMYQDWESVPNGWISNYNLDERIFNLIQETEDFDKNELNALFAWIGYKGNDLDKYDADDIIERFKDAYHGDFDTEVDFIYHLIDETGFPENKMEMYFDYEQYATSLFVNDYILYDGHVFYKRI